MSAAHPWRDRAMALVFAAGVGVPGLALIVTWSETTARFENRLLAQWPKVPVDRAFATGFERAFADRFGGREFLLSLHHRTLVQVFGVSPVPSVVVGGDRWLYLSRSDIESWAVATASADSRARTVAIASGIDRRLAVLRQLGSDYLLVIVPDKQTVYPEHLPRGTALPRISRLDDVLAALPADVRSHVIDLRPALLDAKRDSDVYFHSDTHWNAFGAWAASRRIAAWLQPETAGDVRRPAQGPSITASGDLARMMGVPDLYREALPSLRVPVCARDDAGALPDWSRYRQALHCASAPRGTAIVFHDSMGLALLPTLPDQFRASHWRRQSIWDVDEIAAIAPELVVEEVVERSLEQLAETWFLESYEGAAATRLAPPLWLHNAPFRVGTAPRATASCRLERVNGQEAVGVVELRGARVLAVSGWAGEPTRPGTPAAAWLILSNPRTSLRLRLQTGLERPDVAATFGSMDATQYGFTGTAASDDLRGGEYAASIVWKDAAGWSECRQDVALRP